MVTNITIRDYKLFERGEKLTHPIVKIAIDEIPVKAMIFDLAEYIHTHSSDFRVMSAEYEYIVGYACIYIESKFNNDLKTVSGLARELVSMWENSLIK